VAANFNHQTKTPIVPDIEKLIFERIYDGVPFIFVNVPAYQGNSPARLKNMLSFSRQICYGSYFKCMTPYDVVIGSTPHPFAAWAAQRMAVRWGVPFIIEVRDLWPQTLINLGRISPKHPAIRLMARLEIHLYNHADKIVTLLPGAYEYIKSIGVDVGKVTWIPNGIDFSLFNQLFPQMEHDKFTVMYAGAHGLANGLEAIINCAEIINKNYGNKIVFRLVGDGPKKEHLKKMVVEKQLTNVQFDDPVTKQKIPMILSQADAFVVVIRESPLYKYGISLNKIYDYLACARPVVIGVNAFNNPVEEAKAGTTVPPENPEALAKAVLELYDMTRADRERMGLNGRTYVEENHDFRKLAIKLEEVLMETKAQIY